MRVLHVVASRLRRGAEIFASDLVSALADEGAVQRVAVLRRDTGVHVRFEAPVTALSSNRTGPQRLNLSALGSLGRLVRGWKPDVIQAHGGESLKHAVIAAAGSAPPVVYRRIGMAPRWITRGPRRVGHGLLMRRAARVVTVAEPLRREVIATFGVPATRVLTIPNGVASARMNPSRSREEVRRSMGIDQSAEVLVSLGALTWEKDPRTHLRVAAQALRMCPDAIHLIVGDGPLRGRVDSFVDGMGLDGRVRVVGSRSDVADVLSASDVLLFASRPDGMEGMPASLIEAGMCGLPAAAYGVAGVAEVVHDGVTGFVVEHGDVSGLADRVQQLLGDEGLRKGMGDAARKRCSALFDIEVVARRYADLYEELVT